MSTEAAPASPPPGLKIEAPPGTPPELIEQFERAAAQYNVVYHSLRKGQLVTLDMRSVPDSVRFAFREALEAQCRALWGAVGQWQYEDELWILHPPTEPPAPPPFCGSCGASLPPNDTALRWSSPGSRAVTCHLSGWEHRCNVSVSQAGSFVADMDKPPTNDADRIAAYEVERFREWRRAAERRVAEATGVVTGLRERDAGHLFIRDVGQAPFCRQCGLAQDAFALIPAHRRWRCPGEPQASGPDVLAAIREDLRRLGTGDDTRTQREELSSLRQAINRFLLDRALARRETPAATLPPNISGSDATC